MWFRKPRAPILFLAKFVLVSALLLVAWPPLSRLYLSLLTALVNEVFGFMGHPVIFKVMDDRLYVIYRILVRALPEGLNFLVVKSIRIHFNLILLVALVAATPEKAWSARLRVLALGGLVLLVYHGVYLYLFSYMSVWDWVESGSRGTGFSPDALRSIALSVEPFIAHHTKLQLENLYYFLNNFGREGVPLSIWLGWTLAPASRVQS